MPSNKKIHFEISERKILLRIVDIAVVLFALYVIGIISNFNYFQITKSNFYWTIVLSFYLIVVGTIFEMYNLQMASSRVQMVRSCILTTFVTCVLYFLTPKITPVLPENRLQILYFFFAILSALFLWRWFYIQFLATNRFTKSIVFIGDSTTIHDQIKSLSKGNINFKIAGFLPLDNNTAVIDEASNAKQLTINSFESFINEYHIKEVIVSNSALVTITYEVYQMLLQLLENGIVIQKYADVYEQVNNRLPLQYNDAELYRFFPFSRNNKNRLYLLSSRFLDYIFSIFGLLVMLVFIPFVGFFNIFWNKGPLFYKQERVGKNGKNFTIFKFRTMVTDAEKNGAVYATVNDARITPFGKFLRKSRIDELPQFINVLKGEMAVIGPRPERPVFVNQIAQDIHLYKTRHVIKPGLTGWAQVNYSYGENIEDSLMKLRYDLYYIKHRSIFLDFNIILKTLSTVLFFRGQ
ncbi:sugar transferase [Flavobacterium sp.]|uniref:sugar transferase n=1 Tax=Flavobacterium sp. TaxID=239 RepID=UPI003527C25F